MYESFLVGNYNFIDMSEFMDWVHVVFKNRPDNIDEFVHTVSPEKLFEKYDNTFIKYSNDDRYVLKKFIDNLTSEERIILYYKNNFIQFIDDHPYMKDLYLSVFENVKNYKYYDKDNWKENVSKLKLFDGSELDKMDYKKWKKWVNKEYFMDPNSAPDSIKSILEEFCSLMMKYCYVPYMAFDRIYRLKNFKRRVVTVIDTDSNILALDTVVNYTLNDILPRYDCFGRDKMHNVFICVNTITYVITEAIKQTLLEYGRLANIPEKYRPSLNMKNELTKKFRKRVISWKNLFNCWKLSMRQSAAKIYITGMWWKR